MALSSRDPARDPAGQWGRILDSLREMRLLGPDWDGMGATAPAAEVVSDAIGLAEDARSPGGWPPPSRATATPAGSIVLEWQAPTKYIDIEIDAPGRREWMSSAGAGRWEHGTGLPDVPGYLGGE